MTFRLRICGTSNRPAGCRHMMNRMVIGVAALMGLFASGQAFAAAPTGGWIGTPAPAQSKTNFNIWGRYTESSADMKLRIAGGDLTVWRTWADGVWQINRAWNSLKLPQSGSGNRILIIVRNGKSYSSTDGTLFTYLKRKVILKIATGYRWGNIIGSGLTFKHQTNLMNCLCLFFSQPGLR